MAKKLSTNLIILILLSNLLIFQANADLDIGVDKVFTWFKGTWKKTKNEVKGVFNKITHRSSPTSRPEINVEQRIAKMTPAAITSTTQKMMQASTICGVNRYYNDLIRRNGRSVSDAGLKLPIALAISGGREARLNEAPWQVRLIVAGEQCGGTVLNARTIITAAHCTENQDVTKYKVYLADHNLSETDEGEKVLQISKIIRHPRYDPIDSWSNDFALLIMRTEIALPKHSDDKGYWQVRPVCMPTPGAFEGELGGLRVAISGWGHFNSEEREFARTLRIANVTVVNHHVCKRRYDGIKRITNEMLCAGFDGGDVFVDACQGDSGGSMTFLSNGRYTLIGVTSFGLNCNNKEKIPGVYGRITPALAWIQAHSSGALYYAADN